MQRRKPNAPPIAALRKKQPNEKQQKLVQLLTRVIESSSQDVFKFLNQKDRLNLKQVNRLFYYNLLTFDVWTGLIDGIRVTTNEQTSVKKKILPNVMEADREEDEEQEEKLILEKERSKMAMFSPTQDGSESDSDCEKPPKSMKGSGLQMMKKRPVPQLKAGKQPLDRKKVLSRPVTPQQAQQEQQQQFEETPQQIVRKQFGRDSTSNLNGVPAATAITSVRRSSLLKLTQQQQQGTPLSVKNSSATKSAIKIGGTNSSQTTTASSISSVNRSKIVKDLERSSQILEEQKKKQPANIFQKAETLPMPVLDPLQRTSNSFFKRNFFGKLNYQSYLQQDEQQQQQQQQLQQIENMQTELLDRPQTQVQGKRGVASAKINSENNDFKWLRIPKSIMQSAGQFDANRSFASNMKISEELHTMIDSWILESKHLEKAIDLQSIEVDNLSQEVVLWPEVSKIIDLYKAEYEREEVEGISKVIVMKGLTDEALKRKMNSFNSIKKCILMDRLSKRKFAREFPKVCGDLFIKLASAQFSEFPSIWDPCMSAILDLYEKYTIVFDLRVYSVMEKIYVILVQKMKQCSVGISLAVDLDNQDFTDNILNSFASYAAKFVRNIYLFIKLSLVNQFVRL